MEYKFIPQEFSICILYGGEIKHLNDEFKTSFKNSAYLKRVSTQEGFFYVAKGIICDERFNPLVMIVISSPKIGRSMDMIIKRHVVKIFISKKFFDEKCKFICRIRKHYLPLFLKTDCEIVVRDEIGFLPKIEFNGSKSMEAVNNDFKEFLKNVDLDDYTFSRFNNGIIKPFNLIEL